jgi:hypothetical protein
MLPAPREPSKQSNAKSLPVTKRRAASGVRLSAHAELAASKIKTTIPNRVTIPNLLPFVSDSNLLLDEFRSQLRDPYWPHAQR